MVFAIDGREEDRHGMEVNNLQYLGHAEGEDVLDSLRHFFIKHELELERFLSFRYADVTKGLGPLSWSKLTFTDNEVETMPSPILNPLKYSERIRDILMEKLNITEDDEMSGKKSTQKAEITTQKNFEHEPAQDGSKASVKSESELVGYIRRSRSGGALKISISADAFQKARRYVSQDGHEYVGLVVSLDKVRSVMDGEREVTSVCQIVEAA